MGIAPYRKIAASGARFVILRWFGGNRPAHHWRAVGLPGMVEVLQLACRSCVAVDPRPRASKSSAGLKFIAARSWRADVLARRRRSYQLASSWFPAVSPRRRAN